MPELTAYLEDQLLRRAEQGNERFCSVIRDGIIDFASNDYLGLNRDGVLNTLIEQEISQWERPLQGWHGSGGSRLLTGNSAYALQIEEEIAQFHEEEAGLLFNSGYLANFGLLSALAGRSDTILYDYGVHASVHDAIRYTRARAIPFSTLDQCEERVKKARGKIFVVIDSVDSCKGRQPDMSGIQHLCKKANAHLIVDEAHATGVLGPKGQGVVQELGLQGAVFARVHTFGKALGCQGAVVVGSSLLRCFLINFARPFIYTTALSLQSLAAIRCAYRALSLFPERIEQLHWVIRAFRKKAEERSLPLSDSQTSIQAMHIPGNRAGRQASDWILSNGLDVRPLLSPTVRKGEEVLRICLHVFNSEEELDRLFDCLEVVYDKNTRYGNRD
jgi:8-amino-7-oxononanoate synthase